MYLPSSFHSEKLCTSFKPMGMDFSIKLLFLHNSFMLFLSLFFYLSSVYSIESQLKYSHHCNSVVHQSKPVDEEFNISPFSERQTGYYSGGDDILNRTSHDFYFPPTSKALVFETHHVYTTDVEDVFKVEGSLILQTSYYYEISYSRDRVHYSSSSPTPSRGALDFDFHGFWSRKSGKLCMVGSGYAQSKEGKVLHLEAVLKFDHLIESSTIHTLVTATMDSLQVADAPNHFGRISLLMFPQVSYKYTMVSNELSQLRPGQTEDPEKSSLSLTRSRTICDMFPSGGRANVFVLEYADTCDSSNTCNPLGDGIGYLPQFMSLSMIQCSKNKLQLRFLIEFPNSSYPRYYDSFNFSTSFIGEGSWDAKKNRLSFVACRIFDATNSLKKPSVGDCTTRLSLRFPAVLSIKDTSTVVGEIWSEKPKNQPGFFERIMFGDTVEDSAGIQLQGLKYEYTETEKVKKSCPIKKATSKSRGKYPDGYSTDMSFHISIVNGFQETIGYGSLHPLAAGNEPYQRFPFLKTSSSSRLIDFENGSDSNGNLLNISCKMSIGLPSLKMNSSSNRFEQSSNGYQDIKISAEGLYDAETGTLCMVGCRDLRSENKAALNHSMDCEILVNIQYASNLDRRGKITGSIKSMREETEDLYFKPLHFSGRPHVWSWTSESIWRMDYEMIMSVTSNTLAIVFVALQIFHMRRQRVVSSSVSILMLVVQALGHLTPLLLNFEAIFSQDSERYMLMRSGVWLEMKEVIIRVLTMVAFLLQIRLLMLSWQARCSNQNKKALWIAEKRGLYVCLPLYIAGAIIAFFVSRRNSSYSRYPGQILLGGSRAYAGLILDSFLFPQILFNMFHNSKQHTLSPFFYIGITLVRVVPHGYDLYRTFNFVEIDDTYIYADHAADYYSTAWDLIIPVLGLSFAAIIRSQQRLGGRCFLPKGFQESVIYEEVSMDGEDQVPVKYST